MNIYKRHRFPPDIISYAVWLYHRFNLSLRDIEGSSLPSWLDPWASPGGGAASDKGKRRSSPNNATRATSDANGYRWI